MVRPGAFVEPLRRIAVLVIFELNVMALEGGSITPSRLRKLGV
jgi:hypothetical protein